jgi:DnaD/phage-associated family protein
VRLARARNIKPGFFKNEELAELDPLARILFAGLWCLADREGRLEDRPKRIKAEILPYDDCDINEYLCELQDKGFILRYTVAGNKYIQVINFTAHQNPHHKEIASIIPAPPSQATVEDSMHESSMNQAQAKHDSSKSLLVPLIPDSLNLNTDSLKLIPNSLIADSLNTAAAENPMVTIQQSLQKAGILLPSPIEVETLLAWLGEGIELELILLAIKKAALAGNRRVSYINGILKDMSQNGITTLTQAEAAQAEYERSKHKARGPTEKRKKDDKFKHLYLS